MKDGPRPHSVVEGLNDPPDRLGHVSWVGQVGQVGHLV